MLGESLRRRLPQRRGSRSASGRARRPGWRFWLPALLAALALPFAIGYLLTVFVIFPPRQVAAAGVPVPVLTGLSTVDAEQVLARVGLGRLQVLEVPHPSAPAGQVLAQSPLPDQQLRPGADVRVSVSSGPVQVRLPDVLGQPVERAEELLRRVGFTNDRVEGESSIAAGRVYGMTPAPGTVAILPAHATLHVSLGPPPADTLLLDRAPSAPDTLPPVR